MRLVGVLVLLLALGFQQVYHLYYGRWSLNVLQTLRYRHDHLLTIQNANQALLNDLQQQVDGMQARSVNLDLLEEWVRRMLFWSSERESLVPITPPVAPSAALPPTKPIASTNELTTTNPHHSETQGSSSL